MSVDRTGAGCRGGFACRWLTSSPAWPRGLPSRANRGCRRGRDHRLPRTHHRRDARGSGQSTLRPGALIKDISLRLKVTRNQVKKALELSFAREGRTCPDGRSVAASTSRRRDACGPHACLDRRRGQTPRRPGNSPERNCDSAEHLARHDHQRLQVLVHLTRS